MPLVRGIMVIPCDFDASLYYIGFWKVKRCHTVQNFSKWKNPPSPVNPGEGVSCVQLFTLCHGMLNCYPSSSAALSVPPCIHPRWIPIGAVVQPSASTLLIAAPRRPVDDSKDFFLLGFLYPDAVKCFPHTAVWANERGVPYAEIMTFFFARVIATYKRQRSLVIAASLSAGSVLFTADFNGT